jgi:ABC-type ATPase with predicted acetyltransferase domain
MFKFPNKVEFTLQSEVFPNFRCKMAADSLDIDVNKKSVHHVKIENINVPEEWSVGCVVGNSGSGKTTLLHHIFGSDCFNALLDSEQPIINQFPKSMTYEECANILTGVGLNSVPCWIRAVKTLSNGQKARAEAALLMCQEKQIIFIDEWTSVVDRTVAKAMSICLSKYAKRNKKKIIICSCHFDIIEWLNPDWLIDCNEQAFKLPVGDGFFLSQGNNSHLQSGKLKEILGTDLASIII